jgi:hypothetical protein
MVPTASGTAMTIPTLSEDFPGETQATGAILSLQPGRVLDYHFDSSLTSPTNPDRNIPSVHPGTYRHVVLGSSNGFYRVRMTGVNGLPGAPWGTPDPDDMVPENHPYVPSGYLDMAPVSLRAVAAGTPEMITVRAGTFETRRIRVRQQNEQITAWFAGNILVKLVLSQTSDTLPNATMTHTLQLAYYR